jgi:sensor histidine kinase regulating citrate/malate metabolism
MPADWTFLPETLLEVLPVAVYACDKSGRITYFNDAAVQLWGYRPDLGDPQLKYCACHKVFVNGSYIPPDKTPMAIAVATGQAFSDVEAVVERPDGSCFHASVNITPLFDKNRRLCGAVNLFRDVTEKVTGGRESQIEIAWEKGAAVTVADNGIGFDPAFSKKIVQNHGGTITAEGRPGLGATFSIFLPVDQ